MNGLQILTILSIIFGIVAGLGGGAAYFGKSRGDSIIKYQADELGLRDGTIARMEKEGTSLKTENEVLRAQNSGLQKLAQGSPQLVKVTEQIANLVTSNRELVSEVRSIAEGKKND